MQRSQALHKFGLTSTLATLLSLMSVVKNITRIVRFKPPSFPYPDLSPLAVGKGKAARLVDNNIRKRLLNGNLKSLVIRNNESM